MNTASQPGSQFNALLDEITARPKEPTTAFKKGDLFKLGSCCYRVNRATKRGLHTSTIDKDGNIAPGALLEHGQSDYPPISRFPTVVIVKQESERIMLQSRNTIAQAKEMMLRDKRRANEIDSARGWIAYYLEDSMILWLIRSDYWKRVTYINDRVVKTEVYA